MRRNERGWERWLKRFAPLAMLVFAVMAVAIACGDEDEDDATPTAAAATRTATAAATPTAPPVTGKITVFAASSLTESFKAIGEAFKKANPEASVEFNFAASSALATQIEQAAPADVFASADMPQMQRLVDKSLIEGTPTVFVR